MELGKILRVPFPIAKLEIVTELATYFASFFVIKTNGSISILSHLFYLFSVAYSTHL